MKLSSAGCTRAWEVGCTLKGPVDGHRLRRSPNHRGSIASISYKHLMNRLSSMKCFNCS